MIFFIYYILMFYVYHKYNFILLYLYVLYHLFYDCDSFGVGWFILLFNSYSISYIICWSYFCYEFIYYLFLLFYFYNNTFYNQSITLSQFSNVIPFIFIIANTTSLIYSLPSITCTTALILTGIYKYFSHTTINLFLTLLLFY